MILKIYNSTQVEHGAHGVVGFNYQALKDNIRWHGMSCKKYVPVLTNCISTYLNALRNKA